MREFCTSVKGKKCTGILNDNVDLSSCAGIIIEHVDMNNVSREKADRALKKGIFILFVKKCVTSALCEEANRLQRRCMQML